MTFLLKLIKNPNRPPFLSPVSSPASPQLPRPALLPSLFPRRPVTSAHFLSPHPAGEPPQPHNLGSLTSRQKRCPRPRPGRREFPCIYANPRPAAVHLVRCPLVLTRRGAKDIGTFLVPEFPVLA
ncbi:hypothetical protein BS78_09G183500 [Paspalum vaginatum]|nr:hypothetical protein BS78_09G183500 [Paspalum vaginatum]